MIACFVDFRMFLKDTPTLPRVNLPAPHVATPECVWIASAFFIVFSVILQFELGVEPGVRACGIDWQGQGR